MNKICKACQMLKAGVKFRKAPIHTCDKFKPKTFKLPKFNDDDFVAIVIQRGGLVETGKAKKILLQAQEIAGVKIPRGFEMWVPEAACLSIQNEFSSIPKIHIKGWKINEILRTIVMEGLRNG